MLFIIINLCRKNVFNCEKQWDNLFLSGSVGLYGLCCEYSCLFLCLCWVQDALCPSNCTSFFPEPQKLWPAEINYRQGIKKHTLAHLWIMLQQKNVMDNATTKKHTPILYSLTPKIVTSTVLMDNATTKNNAI